MFKFFPFPLTSYPLDVIVAIAVAAAAVPACLGQIKTFRVTPFSQVVALSAVPLLHFPLSRTWFYFYKINLQEIKSRSV